MTRTTNAPSRSHIVGGHVSGRHAPSAHADDSASINAPNVSPMRRNVVSTDRLLARRAAELSQDTWAAMRRQRRTPHGVPAW